MMELLITLFGIFAKSFTCRHGAGLCKVDSQWVVLYKIHFHAILYLSTSTESLSSARTDERAVTMLACAQVCSLYWLSDCSLDFPCGVGYREYRMERMMVIYGYLLKLILCY